VVVSEEPNGGGAGPVERAATWFDPQDYGGLDDTASSAAVVVEILRDMVAPSSVVDVGCGPGVFVAEWIRQGVHDVTGMDGSPVADVYRGPPTTFRIVDLTLPVGAERRFDLATCFEVAEHLPRESEGVLVSSLVDLAPVVAFSAAPPGQGGHGHVNERWPLHWAGLFAAHGYQQVDAVRGLLVDREEVAWYYRTNLVVFADRHHLGGVLEWADRAEVPDPHQVAFQRGIRSGLVEREWSELVRAVVRKARRRVGTSRLGGVVRRVLPGAGR